VDIKSKDLKELQKKKKKIPVGYFLNGVDNNIDNNILGFRSKLVHKTLKAN
jgi:hypothetical protein